MSMNIYIYIEIYSSLNNAIIIFRFKSHNIFKHSDNGPREYRNSTPQWFNQVGISVYCLIPTCCDWMLFRSEVTLWLRYPISEIECFITMTSQWARLRLKSPASRLFTQTFIRAQIKVNIKAPRHWPLCGEFTGGPVNSPHKWPVTRKMFPFDDVIMYVLLSFPLP